MFHEVIFPISLRDLGRSSRDPIRIGKGRAPRLRTDKKKSPGRKGPDD